MELDRKRTFSVRKHHILVSSQRRASNTIVVPRQTHALIAKPAPITKNVIARQRGTFGTWSCIQSCSPDAAASNHSGQKISTLVRGITLTKLCEIVNSLHQVIHLIRAYEKNSPTF